MNIEIKDYTKSPENGLDNMSPKDVIQQLISDYKERTQDIISKRFGLSEAKKQTLEEIGKNHGITRERVRQIESATLKDIKSSDKLAGLKPCEELLEQLLSENGKVMDHKSLVSEFIKKTGNSATHENIVEFILSISDKFDDHSETNNTNRAWSIKGITLDAPKKLVDALKADLEAKAKPVEEKKIVGQLLDHDVTTELDITDEKSIKSYLSISKEVLRNPYGEWGLSNWEEILPKGVKDKAHLVLKKHGKPLHFTEISNMINEVKFNGKKAIPQTVHNELIKDKRFVLVGRGIYALAKWGFSSGTVSDVIVDVLSKNGGKMERDAIVDEVLKLRMVKKNTVILALQDRARFEKTSDKQFALIS